MLALTKGVALLALAVSAHAPAQHHRPGCPKTYTVAMVKRGALAVYAGTRRVSLSELRMLGRFERCTRNLAQRGAVRAFDHHARALWWARLHPPAPSWAIPWPIVKCESGGRNLPPNGASASGYYQIISSTWRSFGGRAWASAAYLAPKSAQDTVAHRIWVQGGPSQWVCAGITGY